LPVPEVESWTRSKVKYYWFSRATSRQRRRSTLTGLPDSPKESVGWCVYCQKRKKREREEREREKERRERPKRH